MVPLCETCVFGQLVDQLTPYMDPPCLEIHRQWAKVNLKAYDALEDKHILCGYEKVKGG